MSNVLFRFCAPCGTGGYAFYLNTTGGGTGTTRCLMEVPLKLTKDQLEKCRRLFKNGRSQYSQYESDGLRFKYSPGRDETSHVIVLISADEAYALFRELDAHEVAKLVGQRFSALLKRAGN